ncbi:MAG: 50S ribosomal protein L13 [uncultured bacterium]|nr:MAG: 50S ribosomal protein L13 [uncultured bacterium]KKT74915.1 MAG: 50S ribosomal protein L13 [Candidatus Peregrinibacteria bacterium GW2011_GWA2_44_7]
MSKSKMTIAAKLSDFPSRAWFLVDAENMVLGKMATQIANVLRGKNKANFSEHVDCGDYVIVINANKVLLTGNKMEDKLYRRHSGYLGNLKEEPAKDILKKHPKRVIEEAVKGMLPKNKLKKHFEKKLYVYADADHKHLGQNPTPLSIK